MKHLSSWRKWKGCHDNESKKWCHGNIPVPVTWLRCWWKRKSNGSVSCKDGGVLPDTGSSRVSGKRGGPSKWQLGRGADNGCISNIASIRSRTSSRGYTFGACKGDGSRSWREVGVLATAVVEVVVLARSRVDGRGSHDLGDGSGTCLSLHEFP